MTWLLAEDIEPGIRTKWIGHQRCTQCVRNLLLRHANTYFGYVVSGQIVPLVDVRTVNTRSRVEQPAVNINSTAAAAVSVLQRIVI